MEDKINMWKWMTFICANTNKLEKTMDKSIYPFLSTKSDKISWNKYDWEASDGYILIDSIAKCSLMTELKTKTSNFKPCF